jgi:hypothetical protein
LTTAAAGFQEFTVHVYNVDAPGALMQIVNVLCDDVHASGPGALQIR